MVLNCSNPLRTRAHHGWRRHAEALGLEEYRSAKGVPNCIPLSEQNPSNIEKWSNPPTANASGSTSSACSPSLPPTPRAPRTPQPTPRNKDGLYSRGLGGNGWGTLKRLNSSRIYRFRCWPSVDLNEVWNSKQNH